MSPQFLGAASIMRTEVERITDEQVQVFSGATAGEGWAEISHLPS